MNGLRWEVRNPRTGETLSRHKTEAAAWRRIADSHASALRRLNRPGLHGGLDVTKFCERIVVRVGAVVEPTGQGQERHNPDLRVVKP